MLDTLATPFAAAALALCAYFCLTLKRDVRQIHRSHAEQHRSLSDTARDIAAQVDSLAKTVSELERKAAALPQTSPPKPGMTESRRVQVLRMYKRGERTEQIAATLGLPFNEVDLLVKVHQVVYPG